MSRRPWEFADDGLESDCENEKTLREDPGKEFDEDKLIIIYKELRNYRGTTPLPTKTVLSFNPFKTNIFMQVYESHYDFK
ncbi:unnamed protein product [Caretta caretta]